MLGPPAREGLSASRHGNALRFLSFFPFFFFFPEQHNRGPMTASASDPPHHGCCRSQGHSGWVPRKAGTPRAPSPRSAPRERQHPEPCGGHGTPPVRRGCPYPGPTERPPVPALTRLQGTRAALPEDTPCPGRAAVPRWEEASLTRGTHFLGSAAAPAPALEPGSVSPTGAKHSPRCKRRERPEGIPAQSLRLGRIPPLVPDAPTNP